MNAAPPSKYFIQRFSFDLGHVQRFLSRRFDCSHLKQRDANKCHYQNKDFDVGEELHNPDIEASCTIGCRCREQGNTETAKFDCTHIDCPEFFGSPLTETRGKKCIRQYKSKSCCSSNTVCGKR